MPPNPIAMNRLPRRRTRRGFTLLELLLVLVILGVLAALIVPRFAGRSEDAKITAARSDISTISTTLGMFEIDNGRYPTEQEGLAALATAPGNADGWNGPYIKAMAVERDPWGNPYVYNLPGADGEPFAVYSTGPDGQDGTSDDVYAEE